MPLYWCCKPFSIFLILLGAASFAGAQSISFSLKESLPVESSGYNALAGISDMDGDGALEGVVWQLGAGTFGIVERQATGWFSTQTITETPVRTVAFGDVDGDGTDEILSGNAGVATIREASGDNTYAITGTQNVGTTIEQATRIGDSNGNGMLEFLIPRETTPAMVHIVEGTGDDTYTSLGSVSGSQFNCTVAGTADVDGDGLVELVFHDSPVSPGAFATHVFESGALVTSIPNFAAHAIGDTDGNGLVEIIGRTQPGTVNDTRIFESNGNNSYIEVWSDPAPYRVLDLDRDGASELHAVTMNGVGERNILTIYDRSGGTAVDIWNSDLLFQGSSDPITSVIDIGDTDSNGHPEVAVLQGLMLHIIEREPFGPMAGVPAVGGWTLLILGSFCAACGARRLRLSRQ